MSIFALICSLGMLGRHPSYPRADTFYFLRLDLSVCGRLRRHYNSPHRVIDLDSLRTESLVQPLD